MIITASEYILSHWFTSLDKNDKTYIKAHERLNQCVQCDELKEGNIELFLFCGKCECALRNKIFKKDDNECPLGKWK